MNVRSLKSKLGIGLLGLMLSLTIAVLIIFLVIMFSKGWRVLNPGFIFESPRKAMTEGGIFPAVIGTFYLTMLAMLIAMPLGVLSSIYLTNYNSSKWLVKAIKISVNTLAGTPSIIFGLFGMAVFVNILKLNVSLISGALTLAILALPVIITNTEEALRTVPREFIDASLALGATKRQTILRVQIPSALPSILTVAILSIGRIAGETAPIMFTAATFYSRRLPEGLGQEVMALPYHIYALMTEGTHPDKQVPIAYGTALVLLLLVLLISTAAVTIRTSIRRKRKW